MNGGWKVATAGSLLLVAVTAAWPGGKEPDRVVVQHVLISFKGRIQGKEIARTKAQAEALADEILKRATSGEDFDALVRKYTDDRQTQVPDQKPGVYTMVNRGKPDPPGTSPRGKMAQRFGDVAFSLAVGEVGLARYHSALSPYGWHVIKRLE